MKMSGLCWIAGMLIFLLSAGNSFDVDNKQLAHFVEYIMNRYDIKKQVSVAVNIPLKNAERNLVNYRNRRNGAMHTQDADQILKTDDDNLLAEVLTKASAAAVSEKISNQQNPVYPGVNDNSVVVAKTRFYKEKPKSDHTEALVLDNIGPLVNSREGKMLLFYTYNSPCGDRCTNKANIYNILTKIKEIIPKWETHAFVFSNPFDNSEEKRREALKQLGNSIGNDSIFRCYKPTNLEFRCIKCIKGTDIEKDCVEGK